MTSTFDGDWLRRKVLDVMAHGPTKPPYVVKVYNENLETYYISGAACNIFGTRFFLDKEEADGVATMCNKIAQEKSIGDDS